MRPATTLTLGLLMAAVLIAGVISLLRMQPGALSAGRGSSIGTRWQGGQHT